MKKQLLVFCMGLFFSAPLLGQVGINNSSPNVTLEVTAKKTDGTSSEGIIAPRLTGDALHQADLNNKYGILQDGTFAYVTAPPSAANTVGQTINIDAKGYYYYDSTKNQWIKFRAASNGSPGLISSLNCISATIVGELTYGQALPASGINALVPYVGGNGGVYSSQSANSYGVLGLTANLLSGTLTNGAGNVTYTITGTPLSLGTASFDISVGGQLCTLTIDVVGKKPVVTNLSCQASTIMGNVTLGIPTSGVSASVPYTGGNGASYSSQNVNSEGVLGLTATLSSGTLANGSGNLVYSISGIPSTSGTAIFPISIGGKSCTLTIPVQESLSNKGSGTLSGKTCFDVVMGNFGADCGTLANRTSQKADFSLSTVNTQTYTFIPISAVSNIRFYYVNTNGSVIQSLSGGNPGNNIATGVTATVSYNPLLNSLASGTTRSNALTAKIIVLYNDSPNNTGTDVQLTLTVNIQDCACCGALIAPGVWKNFMCQNLGADMTADPFIPSAAIHGAKYQWGYRPSNPNISDTRYLTQEGDQTAVGNTNQWVSTGALIGSWSDSVKTADDPCPAGYRVPTAAQWQGVGANNLIEYVGTWSFMGTVTNDYSAGILAGKNLFLPAAGSRTVTSGAVAGTYNNGINNRNRELTYWSSTTNNVLSYIMRSSNGNPLTGTTVTTSRYYGLSVRCISE